MVSIIEHKEGREEGGAERLMGATQRADRTGSLALSVTFCFNHSSYKGPIRPAGKLSPLQ